jgi:hypothetical protein
MDNFLSSQDKHKILDDFLSSQTHCLLIQEISFCICTNIAVPKSSQAYGMVAVRHEIQKIQNLAEFAAFSSTRKVAK